MKDLKALRGKYYIARCIEEGEHEHQDFKYAINDAFKIAHSISAFANNDGGRLLIGVKDNGTVAGVRNEEDVYVVEQAALMYCDPPQKVEFTSFRAEGGAVVIRAEIARAEQRPVMCRDSAGTYRAYYRVADENIPATDLMVSAWRYKSRHAGSESILLSESDTALLRAIPPEGTTLAAAARTLHISLAAATQATHRLHTLGLLDFAYRHGHFLLIAPPAK